MKPRSTWCVRIALGATLALGCATGVLGAPIGWEVLSLQGRTLNLVDGHAIETYHFLADGLVVSTVGTREGPSAGPLLYWHILGDSLVISEEPDAQSMQEFGVVHLRGEILTVQRKGGSVARFRLSMPGDR